VVTVQPLAQQSDSPAMSPASAPRRRLYQWFARVHGAVLIATKGRPVSLGGNFRFFVLETLGRRSGAPRRLPLLFMPYGPDFLVLASNYGQERPPAWFLNLQAEPEASVVTGGRRIAVRARVLEGDERQSIVPTLLDYNAHWRDYFANVQRTIPVVLLERR
jgi:deazaflavin-dependent oxidoreductase (nitroreductase family)